MSIIRNPFIVKGEIPDEFFCDRERETELLTKYLLNGHNILLTAPRRVGKTGLIEHCFKNNIFQTDYHTFFIDILETTSLRELTYSLGRAIFTELKTKEKRFLDQFITTLRSINGQFSYDSVTGTPSFNISLGTIENPEYTLSEIFEYINNANKTCIIAIDEFQQITFYPEKNIEAILRKHIQHCKNANFIFAGSERHILNEIFNQSSRPFYSSTSEVNLSEIPIEKYIDFAKKNFELFNKDIEAESIVPLYQLVSGNTYCLQKVMNEAFYLTEKGKRCTAETINMAINDILEENERNYKNRLSMISSKQKELLIAIALEGKAQQITSGVFVKRHFLSSTSSVQSATKQLLDDGWITFETTNEGKRIYHLEDHFFALWCRKHFGAK